MRSRLRGQTRVSSALSFALCAKQCYSVKFFASFVFGNLPVVEMMGFEPMTPCLQGRCSPSWATPPNCYSGFCFFSPREPQNSFHSFRGPLVLKDPSKLNNEPKRFHSLVLTTNIVFLLVSCLHRKEVIQPHLPIRLPCYDLTPIIEPTFGHCLLAVSAWTSGVPNFHGLTGGVYKARERIHRGMLIRDY